MDIWTTGITVSKKEYGWSASFKLYYGSLVDNYMEGDISTNCMKKTLSEVIDYVLSGLSLMNVKRSDEIERMREDVGFSLYCSYEETEVEVEDIKEEIKSEAKKRGWRCYL